MVKISQLTEAIRRTLWRQGFVHPEALKHTTDEQGDHHFALTIPKSICEYEAPPDRVAAKTLGHSTANFTGPKGGG